MTDMQAEAVGPLSESQADRRVPPHHSHRLGHSPFRKVDVAMTNWGSVESGNDLIRREELRFSHRLPL